MKIYPAWRYHATLPACVVQTPEDDDALGPGWDERPVEVPTVVEPPPDEARVTPADIADDAKPAAKKPAAKKPAAKKP